MKSLLLGCLFILKAQSSELKLIRIYAVSHPWIIEVFYDHSGYPIHCYLCDKQAEFIYIFSEYEIYATCQDHYCFDQEKAINSRD